MQEQSAAPDERYQEAKHWISGFASRYGCDTEHVEIASIDASFRRYFRVSSYKASYIVMDAPPEHESIDSFMKVDSLMAQAGLHVPRIYEHSVKQGFILMEDLGSQTYLDVLNEDNAMRLFGEATDALVKWQVASKPGVLPPYDEAILRRELELFPQWYIEKHCGYHLNDNERAILEKTFDRIIAHNLAEERVYVHRDFMPRNLMISKPNPGVLDFQDALYGPLSYDIASLMRDAFISWSESFVLDTTIRYWEKARKAGLPVPKDFGVFWRNVEWMSLQRHLKILGIFARINYRDGKPKYLADTPRFIRYVRHTSQRYDELKAINWLLDKFDEQKTQEVFTY